MGWRGDAKSYTSPIKLTGQGENEILCVQSLLFFTVFLHCVCSPYLMFLASCSYITMQLCNIYVYWSFFQVYFKKNFFYIVKLCWIIISRVAGVFFFLNYNFYSFMYVQKLSSSGGILKWKVLSSFKDSVPFQFERWDQKKDGLCLN